MLSHTPPFSSLRSAVIEILIGSKLLIEDLKSAFIHLVFRNTVKARLCNIVQVKFSASFPALWLAITGRIVTFKANRFQLAFSSN